VPVLGVRGGQLKLLSQDEIYDVHLASLNILERVGMLFELDAALGVWSEAGASVDRRTKIVKIPQYLVGEAIKKTATSVTLCGRDPKYDLRLEGKSVHVGGAMGAINVQDFTGNRRPGTTKDLEDITRIEDALENVHVVPTAISPQDVPKIGLYPKAYEAIVNNTEKHVYHDSESIDELKSLVEMAAIVVGGEDELQKRPIISFANCPVSPLTANKRFIQVLMHCAKLRLPFSIEPDPQMGGTSPVTLIGTIIQTNAEVLGGLTLAQIISPGTPVIYSHGATTMDMRASSMGVSWGAPERGLLNVATGQLTQYYGIPSCCIASTTDSKSLDVQAGYEKASTFLMTALSGVNLIHSGIGMIDSNLTVNYEELVVDNELMGMAFRMLRGIRIDEESIEQSLETISRVGPLGGHYLSQAHTRKHFKSEHWIPEIIVRGRWETWEKTGAKNVRDIAKEKGERILAEHELEPLPKEIQDKIKRIAQKSVMN